MMILSDEDLIWAEQFYKHMEQNDKKYKRPDDWLERAERIIYGKRKPVKQNLWSNNFTGEMNHG